MKKAQKAMREFSKLSSQLKQINEIVNNSRDSNLWNHEAAVRKRIRELKDPQFKLIRGYSEVLKGYLHLLDKISRRLLNFYNKKNKTNFKFEEIVQTDKTAYISSGIISVLITSHIPKLVAEEFKRFFPANPKDEYKKARKLRRKIYLHLGETNTGKTYRAVERLKRCKKGVYLAPLRILALENFEKLNRDGVPCSLITGEEEILVEGATHVCSTIEKLEIEKFYDVAVIDEIQMISNSQRGQAWTRALLGLNSNEIHVCGAINSKELLIRIIEDCGDAYEITEYKRETPLEIIEKPFNFSDIEKGDALVAFSKKRVLELSKYFQDKGIQNSVIYGDLPPEVRRMQYQAFLNGTNTILITTDAIGMGVNLPIRRIIFMNLQKFDGEDIRYLTSQEIKQIGGRAGRKGIYDTGYVGTVGLEQNFIRENLETQDEPLSRAVLGPGEAIINIKGLPLKEKLALWSTRSESLRYYRKMDIRDYLLILENLKYFKLPEEIQYRLMNLPFDVNDDDTMDCFVNYVDEFFNEDYGSISKPRLSGYLLYDYEKYYQMLNLYYSFSKNFNVNFEPEWVYGERKRVSKIINELLVKL